MAIAIFNDQDTLAGQKLGISTGKAIGLMIVAAGCAAMNVYHMGNTLTSKLLSPESSIFLFVLIYFIALCIAFMEIPVTEEIVTQSARGRKATGHRIMLLIVVTMAAGAGLYSITSDADKRAATITAHDTAELSYQDRANALISDRNIARASATNTAERSKANADYYRALAALRLEQSTHQSHRPALAVKTDSVFHWVWAIGFSLLCSIGVVVITAYLTKYHKPLTEIPRVFFRVREEQDWTMTADDVRVLPANVDLTGGASTKAARQQLSRPIQSESSHLTSNSGSDTRNRPEQAPTIPRSGLNNSNDASDRILNTDTQKGGKVEYSQNHYDAIKQGVLNGDIKPTQKPVRDKLVSLNVRFVDDAERARKASDILDMLKAETVLIDNPEFGKSKKIVAKYVVNPDYSGVDWEEVIARLDRGEYVDPKEVGDISDGSGRKPQGWIDYEQQLLEKALNSSSTEKVNGGTIHRSGHIYSFTPDTFAKPEKVSVHCPKCDELLKVSEHKLTAWGNKLKCRKCKQVFNVERAKENDQ